MRDDSRAFEEEDQDDAGDPAVAFEALRATVDGLAADLAREMTTIRKAVEAAFDQFERHGAPVDYSADLGRIVRNLATVGERLRAVEESPLLRHGPDHHAHALQQAGQSLIGSAVEELESERYELSQLVQTITDSQQGRRKRQAQNRFLWSAGGAGAIGGVLLVLFVLPPMLPSSVAPSVAARIMGKDAWVAGMDLMAFDSPSSLNRIAAADALVEANKDVVAACRQAAIQTQREQKCTIVVSGAEK